MPGSHCARHLFTVTMNKAMSASASRQVLVPVREIVDAGAQIYVTEARNVNQAQGIESPQDVSAISVWLLASYKSTRVLADIAPS